MVVDNSIGLKSLQFHVLSYEESSLLYTIKFFFFLLHLKLGLNRFCYCVLLLLLLSIVNSSRMSHGRKSV